MYWTYILYSQTLNKYYVGSTSKLNQRLSDHNTGRSHYTARGKPWELGFVVIEGLYNFWLAATPNFLVILISELLIQPLQVNNLGN